MVINGDHHQINKIMKNIVEKIEKYLDENLSNILTVLFIWSLLILFGGVVHGVYFIYEQIVDIGSSDVDLSLTGFLTLIGFLTRITLNLILILFSVFWLLICLFGEIWGILDDKEKNQSASVVVAVTIFHLVLVVSVFQYVI